MTITNIGPRIVTESASMPRSRLVSTVNPVMLIRDPHYEVLGGRKEPPPRVRYSKAAMRVDNPAIPITSGCHARVIDTYSGLPAAAVTVLPPFVGTVQRFGAFVV